MKERVFVIKKINWKNTNSKIYVAFLYNEKHLIESKEDLQEIVWI